MKYSTLISLLICALVAFSTASALEQSSQTIKLKALRLGSGKISIAVKDEEITTIAVQVLSSAKDAVWTALKQNEDAWILEFSGELVFPLSVRITSKDQQELVFDSIITGKLMSTTTAQDVDTGAQYSKPSVGKRASSHGRNHRKGKTTTAAPTAAPTKTTTKPTTAPKATSKATTKATTAPTTKAPTKTTTAPASDSSSSASMKLMVPLYMYPGSAWDTVAAGASSVPTVAIINPNSGPGNGPDSTYKTYMAKLQNAGVEQIGYVHTSYGARAIADVKADIAKYASEFPQVIGIFIDEAANTAAQVSYYTQVYNYIMSMPGYKYCVLNPGAVPTAAYVSISTQIVSFEDTISKFATSANPSFANAATKSHYSVISYGATQAQMVAGIATAKSKGYYGWVYFTSYSGASTYNTLPSYYAAMVSAVKNA